MHLDFVQLHVGAQKFAKFMGRTAGFVINAEDGVGNFIYMKRLKIGKRNKKKS
jgi:hypothetical protein